MTLFEAFKHKPNHLFKQRFRTNLEKRDVEEFSAEDNPELVQLYRKKFKNYSFVFNTLDDISFVSNFVWKYNLNAKFYHPMFENERKEQKKVPSLGVKTVQINKEERKTDNVQKPITSSNNFQMTKKTLSSSNYDQLCASESSLIKNLGEKIHKVYKASRRALGISQSV